MTNVERADKVKAAADKYYNKYIGLFDVKEDREIIKQDKKDLYKLARMVGKGEGWIPEIVELYQSMDTIVRGSIPNDVWKWIYSGRSFYDSKSGKHIKTVPFRPKRTK
jgi:hypothetical protein